MRGLVALALVAGCAETVKAPPPPPVAWASLTAPVTVTPPPRVTATEKERAVASLYTKALASPSLSSLGAALDDEAHFRVASGKDVRGRQGVVKAHDALLNGFVDRSVTVTRVLLTDSSQSIEWTMSCMHALTRKPVVIRGVTLLWTKDDGSITDVHLYLDEAVVQAQLGAGPEALRGFRPAPPSSGGAQSIEQQKSVDEAANVAVARARLQALEDNNETAFVSAYADDVEIETLESPRPTHGKTAVRNYFRAMRAAINYLATSIENAWGVGTFVVVEYQILGEQRGTIGWVPPQRDRLIKLCAVDILEMRDGKIVHVWRYDDPGQIQTSP